MPRIKSKAVPGRCGPVCQDDYRVDRIAMEELRRMSGCWGVP